jgi:hypothetical protein
VREAVLRDVVCEVLRNFGATEGGDLVQSVARQLGFKRTGPRIQERVEHCLETLIRSGTIGHTADQRLQLSETARAASG